MVHRGSMRSLQRRACRSARPCRAAHARRGRCWCQPPQVCGHNSRDRAASSRSGRPYVHGGRAECALVADITYIPTWAGFLYLAVVLDVFSRRIVGWSMSTTLHTTVVLDALSMALAMRRPRGVIHHSDQGSQYTSIEFGNRCRQAGVRPSMGSVGDAYDNAMAEVSLPRWNASYWLAAGSKRKPRRAMPSSSSSKASTIRAVGIRRSGTCHQSSSSGGTGRVRLPRRTPSCHRARSRQGQALAGARSARP